MLHENAECGLKVHLKCCVMRLMPFMEVAIVCKAAMQFVAELIVFIEGFFPLLYDVFKTVTRHTIQIIVEYLQPMKYLFIFSKHRQCCSGFRAYPGNSQGICREVFSSGGRMKPEETDTDKGRTCETGHFSAKPAASEIFTLPNVWLYMYWGKLSLDTLFDEEILPKLWGWLPETDCLFCGSAVSMPLSDLFSVIFYQICEIHISFPSEHHTLLPLRQRCLTNDTCLPVCAGKNPGRGCSLTLIHPYSFTWIMSKFFRM